MKTYSELSTLDTFEDRFKYLKIGGKVGRETFGIRRHINQAFYRSMEWYMLRDQIIIRDNGCDLGIPGYEIPDKSKLIIHHINPITEKDILDRSPELFNPDNLICTTLKTHNAIHYGDESILFDRFVTRSPNDTCPWRC